MARILRILGILTLVPLGSCGEGREDPTEPDSQILTHNLVIGFGAGVEGTPPPSVTEHPAGTVIDYSYSPKAGYDSVLVELGGSLVASAGSIVVDRRRELFVTAVPALSVVPPQAEPVYETATAVAQAVGETAIVRAYEEHLQAVLRIYRDLDTDIARSGALAAYARFYDETTDADLEAISHALAGKVVRRDGTITIVDQTRAILAAPEEAGAGITTSVIGVNGILVSEAAYAFMKAELDEALGEAGLSETVQVLPFYNPSALYDRDAHVRCIRKASQTAVFNLQRGAALLTLCEVGLVFADLAQAGRQIAEIYNVLPLEAEREARALADLIRQERSRGRSVICVGHSQGTLMCQQAFHELGGHDQCVAGVSLAGPLGMASWQPWVAPQLLGVLVEGNVTGDVIRHLGMNDFPRVATDISRDADARIERLEQIANPYTTTIKLLASQELVEDVRLHFFESSYMAGIESRQLIKERLFNLVQTLGEQANCSEACQVGTGPFVLSESVSGPVSSPGAPSDLYRVEASKCGLDELLGRIRTADGHEPFVSDIARYQDQPVFGVAAQNLYRIDPTSGLAEEVGSMGVSGVVALAFDTSGSLYGATKPAFGVGSGNLIRIDTQTAQDSVVGTLGSDFDADGDIAFAPDGTLFGTIDSGSDALLVTIDATSGTATRIGEGSIGFANVWGLVFVENNLFGLTSDGSGTGYLIKLSLDDGTGTVVRRLSFNAGGAAAAVSPGQ